MRYLTPLCAAAVILLAAPAVLAAHHNERTGTVLEFSIVFLVTLIASAWVVMSLRMESQEDMKQKRVSKAPVCTKPDQ